MMDKGCLIISLDYELMWGIHDVGTKDVYGKSNVANVPIVIDRLLLLFEKYGVHATFATVGMLMCKDKEELLRNQPERLPSYEDIVRSPYGKGLIENIQTDEHTLFFQPDIVDKLKNTIGIEIGTHTFSHYYCWENGQTLEQFDADIKTAVEIAKKKGINITSIVFPKNQVSINYLNICTKYGIKYYRGNAESFFGEPKNVLENVKNKICRFLDAYWNIGGMTTIPYKKNSSDSGMTNIQASRFVRPYSKMFSLFESLRLKRICKEMVYAAQHKQCYHIWWHPHNFGADMEENLTFLEEILKCYKTCNEEYGMVSLTMSELGDKLNG